MLEIDIEPIGRQTATTGGLVEPLLRILNKCQDMSGPIGFFTEKELLSFLMEGKIYLIKKTEPSDKAKLIGVVATIMESKINDSAIFSLAFEHGTRIETIRKSLKELIGFAVKNKSYTKISLIIAKQGELDNYDGVNEFLGDTGFKPEGILQKALKLQGGFGHAWLCSSSTNGRGFDPQSTGLITPVSSGRNEITTGLNSEIETLKTQLESKTKDIDMANRSITDFIKRIAGLEKNLKEETVKRASAEDNLFILKGKLERADSVETINSISALRQKIAAHEQTIEKQEKEIEKLKVWLNSKNKGLEETGNKTEPNNNGEIIAIKAINIQLTNEIAALKEALNEKSKRIFNQIDIINEKNQIIASLQKDSETQPETFEIKPHSDLSESDPLQITEVAVNQQDNKDPLEKKEEVILPEPASEKSESEIEPIGSPIARTIQPEEVKEEIKLNRNQISVLNIVVKYPNEGITHKEIRTKMARHADEKDSAFQVRTSSAIIFLATKNLVENKKSKTSKEKIVTPIMDNIARYFPELIKNESVSGPKKTIPPTEVQNSDTDTMVNNSSENKSQQPEEIAGKKIPIKTDNAVIPQQGIADNTPKTAAQDQTQQKDIRPAQPLTDYDRIVSLLTKYGEDGISAIALCKEAEKDLSIHFSIAKTILFNLDRQKRLKYIARANNLMNSKIALKQDDTTIKY